ncbi:MAG: metallophosphoesterase [Roseburia sp.]|nr:metallophosphoesterase [Roseburia sp.]MCM1097640.1 metallophosphoesterase [Ruminococcus flavefaciens]
MNYVIGDVHGCYHALMRLLERLRLTEEDRVYFVGDFVDRAPDHGQMLMTNRWVCEHITEDGPFQAVLGNHDLDLLDTYQELSGYEGTPAFSFLIDRDTYGSLGDITKKIRTLPLFRRVEAGGFTNIITHSWLCDEAGRSAIAEDGSVREDYSIRESLWDREHSIKDIPGSCRVIHGHTITSSSCYGEKRRGAQSKILFQGAANVNVDCGCFMGLANGGNLAAFRLEDGAAFYAYDLEDAVAVYEELAQLSQEPYALRDYQIFLACNPLREQVFLYDDSDYVRYALNAFEKEQKVAFSDREAFFERCRKRIYWWKACIRRNRRIDSRFIVWSE